MSEASSVVVPELPFNQVNFVIFTDGALVLTS